MPTNRKSFYFTIGMINVFFFLLAGVISEFAIRWMRPQMTFSRLTELLGEQYTTGDFIPFTLKPNYSAKSPSQEFSGKYVTVSTNKFGLRGKEISKAKPEKTKRILVLGDSYTFGVYVENYETYPWVLERFYNEDTRRSDKIEVINAGYADGWSPDEHYAWLVNRGLEFQPDIIVYGFFIGNDIPPNGERKEYWVKYDNKNLPTKIVNTNICIDAFGRIKSKVKDDKTIGVEKIYSIPIVRESHLLIYL